MVNPFSSFLHGVSFCVSSFSSSKRWSELHGVSLLLSTAVVSVAAEPRSSGLQEAFISIKNFLEFSNKNVA